MHVFTKMNEEMDYRCIKCERMMSYKKFQRVRNGDQVYISKVCKECSIRRQEREKLNEDKVVVIDCTSCKETQTFDKYYLVNRRGDFYLNRTCRKCTLAKQKLKRDAGMTQIRYKKRPTCFDKLGKKEQQRLIDDLNERKYSLSDIADRAMIGRNTLNYWLEHDKIPL